MLKQQFPNHYFHAHGVAFGGVITEPFHEVIESQAATAISSVGGFARASAGPFNFRDIITFHKASTQIGAVEEKERYDTFVTCRLEGINILNQLTADEVVAVLSIKHPKDGSGPTFSTVGSRFVNLRVGGVKLDPKLDQECDQPCGEMYKNGRGHAVYDLYQPAEKRTPVTGGVQTLVAEVDVPSSCLTKQGNAIYVPDFGVVYLAEYFVTPHDRLLNMFRVKLGCAFGGSGEGTGVGGNGKPTST